MKKRFPLFSVLVVVFLIPLQVWSQNVTVTVGTGTATTNTSPINSYYRHSWTECIYQASDIAEDGYIYRVAWECSDAYSFFMNTMEIYMGTTPNTTHASSDSWLPMDQLTLVYSGVSVNIPNSTGWLYFDLDNAFEYSSDENLVIVVAKTAPSWTSSLRFYATSSNNAVLYRRNDNSTDYANHPGTASGTLSSDLANVRLFFTSVRCPSATNITISDITTESALATWTGDPSNTSWLVGWGLTETAAQTNVITVQDTFVVLDNLSSESQYYFSIQSVCDTISNGHWKTTRFRTLCAGNYLSGGCFDLTNLSNPGITCMYGDFYDPYYYTGIAQNRHTVMTQLQYDPNTNYTLPTIPDCRDYSVRLGNDGTGAEAESISLDYVVDTMQADLIILQYAVVMEDPGHDPEDQPRFTMEILNSANQLIDPGCGYDDFVASSGLGWSSSGGVIWNEWTTVGMDISAYHGQNVKVRMTTYDCEQGGHFGYAYFLLDCGSKRMKSDFCGLDTIRTFTAPAGFRYEWYWESNPDSIISVDRSVTFFEEHNERIFCKVTSLSKDSCYFRIYGSLEPRYPIADFSTTVDNCTRTCVFHNESVVSADGITPNSYFEPCDNALWDFGDGTVSQQYNPTHTYSSSGTYQVMLVSGLHDFSCTDTAFYTITLHPNYTYIDSSVCNSCTWNGAIYTQSGTYTYATQSTSGCDSTVVLNLQVNPSPTVAISGPTTLCADSSVVLTTDSAYSYLWSTGDTTQSISVTEAGSYSLTITNEFGCPAEASHQVTSMGNPNMSVTVPTICAGGTYTLSVDYQFGDYSTAGGPWVTTLSDSLFRISPPAGLNHDTTIAYTFTVYDTGGCAHDTMVYITVHAIPHVYIDSIVCNSCMWNGAVYTQSGSYIYTTQGSSGCDSIVVLNLIVSPPMTATITGPTTLCTDSAEVLTADSAYSYLWSTGDTTQVISVAMEGTYSLTVTNEYGCSAVASHQMTSLGNPIMSVTVPEMCAGGSYTLSVGHQDNDNIHLGHGETTLSLVDTIFLPDGIYCEPNGCSYRSPLTFTAYADDATIQSVEDIYYVKLNIEHSWIGDLYINITCPNGQKADLMKYGGSGTSQCNSQIASSSRGWQSGNNMNVGTYFGNACIYGVASCDATDFGNEPGVGWNYCWSENTTQGYGYAQGNDGLIYRSGNSHNGIVDSSNVAAGTQFYHPDDSFSNLIGCPLNGDWYIEVQDGWSGDNGYIFGWELSLSSEALPNIDFELDYSTASGPWVTTLSDSLFQITPLADLNHDTTIAYTFTVYDTGGCAYDTTVYITVHAIPHTEIDTAVCEVLTYDGISYTASGQYTQTYNNVFGCDSILTLNLNILPPTDSTLVVSVVENNLPYQLNGNPYTTSGTYTQHLDNAAGCDSLLTLVLTVLYNVTNTVDTTVCAANLPITWHGQAYTAAGTHTNVLTASNGVDSTVTYTLNVDELSASVGNVTHVVCYGEATGAAMVTVTGGQSPLNYQWTTAAGTGISTTTTVSGCAAGSYTFTVTDQLGCTVTVTVTVNTLNDSMQPGTIASDQEVCSGNEIEAFTGTSAVGGDNSAYQWQISTNNTDWTPALGNNTGQNYSYPNLSSESFWLRRAWISQSCGTVYSNTVMLTVLPVTHDTITADVCQNNDYQGYGFEVPASEIEQPGEYVFERIQTTGPCDTFFVLLLTVHPEYSTDISDEICEGGGYFAHGFNIPAPATIDVEFLSQTLNLQSVHGCDSTVHLELSVTDTAIRIIPLTTDFCENMSAELMVETAMEDYVWSTGEQVPTITVTQPGIYSVTASQGGCEATAHIQVENCQFELYLPNAITPSKGDGLNDYFSIPAYNQLGMDKFEISIFNRWGEQVFYSTDKNFKWNGEYRGQIHQEAIYNYIIHYTDLKGKPHKVIGNIIVL